MSTVSDADLLARVDDGDAAALAHVIDAHLHPAWRLAVVAAPDHAVAERAVVEGFCDGLAAAARHPDPRHGLRIRLVSATRHAAVTASPGTAHPLSDDPVIAAFRELPEAWRTALWLVEVEGGSPEQVAPVLGLTRSSAAALADRAATGFRERLAADIAERASNPDCRRALAKLPAHASGKLTAEERDAVGEHLGGCGSCAVWLAALVSPRPALRRMITPPPASLGPAIADRWAELLRKRGAGWLGPLTERAVGAAAAAVLAVGIGGAALLGGRDRGDRGPELALPTSAEPTGDDPSTGGTGPGTGPTVESPTGGGSSSSSSGSSTGGASTASSSSTAGSTSARPTPTTVAPRTTPTPVTPTPPPPPPPPPPSDPEQEVAPTLGVPGVVEIEVGGETPVAVEVLDGAVDVGLGGPEVIEVEIPGLL